MDSSGCGIWAAVKPRHPRSSQISAPVQNVVVACIGLYLQPHPLSRQSRGAQMPVAMRVEDCPETLLLDRARLVAAQNELQRLSLVAAALLIAAQLLAMKRLPPGTSSPENRRSVRITASRHDSPCSRHSMQ